MSYRAAAALQAAIYARLAGWPGLAGVAVVDAIPAGEGDGTFVLIGPEVAEDKSDGSGAGAEHRLQVSVISDADGFLSAKQVAAEVSAALEGADLALATGRLVGLGFTRAVARRLDEGAARRIDLTFRARTEI
ncbi:MAG: DUF3168 domain-containing protein [Paracoccaceae bacterium]